MPSEREAVGARIREARERRHWTQGQLASYLEVDRKSVDNWENGRHSPRSRAAAIKELLDIDIAGPDTDEASGRHSGLDRTDRHIAQILDNTYLSEGDKAMAIRALLQARGDYGRTIEPSPSQGGTPSDPRTTSEAP